MFGLQSFESEHLCKNGAPGYASYEVGNSTSTPLRVEQIHDYNGNRLVDGSPFARRTGNEAQSDGESLQDRRGSSHLLRGETTVLSSQHMVPTYRGDQKYDEKSVHVMFFLLLFSSLFLKFYDSIIFLFRFHQIFSRSYFERV